MPTRMSMYPPRRDRDDARARFDPGAEGARYGLARDRSLAIWDRAWLTSTDAVGRTDVEAAHRQFHALAARLASRGGRLQPEVGKRTRVESELGGEAIPAVGADVLAVRAPGRETLVQVAARGEPERGELPGAGAEAMDGRPSGVPLARAESPRHGVAPRRGIFDLAQVARLAAPAGGQALPFRDHFERTLGVDLRGVSARVGQQDTLRPLGARAATRGMHIDFFDEHPSRELVGHELVHVLQNLGSGAPDHGVSQRGDAAEREAETLGPRLAAGHLVAPRARPSAALQLDRNDNLNLQWELEERLKQEFPKGTFLNEAKKLFALIRDQVPELDAAAKAGEVWEAVMAGYSRISRTEDHLRKETPDYAEFLQGLRADVAARLTLVDADTVQRRAQNWQRVKAFWPQATPFVLLQQLYTTLGENKAAHDAFAKSIPAAEDVQKAMQGAWDQACREEPGVVPKHDLTASVSEYHGAVTDAITDKAASVLPTQRAADYAQAMRELTEEMTTALTPPAPSEIVARVRRIRSTPALRGMTAIDVMKPEFEQTAEQRLANAKLRTAYLNRLEERYPRQGFVDALLALYPKLATSPTLVADAGALYDEELARLRERVEGLSLALAPEAYKDELIRIDALEAQLALDIPKVPRQYHSNAADEDVGEQQASAEADVGEQDDIVVHGAEPGEAKYITNYLFFACLPANSEHRVIIPIGPAQDSGATPRGRLVVTVDEERRVVARLVERTSGTSDEVDDSPEETGRLQAALIVKFGVRGFDVEGAAVWTTSDVHKLAAALDRVPDADREALRDITFVRANSLDKKANDGRTLGLFTNRPVDRRIKLADVAFEGDALAFAGTRDTVASSTQVALHEIAHAIEHKPQLDALAHQAEVERAKPKDRLFHDELDALADAQPQAIADRLRGALVTVSVTLLVRKSASPAWRVAAVFKQSVESVLDDASQANLSRCNAAWQDVEKNQEAIAELFPGTEAKQIADLKIEIVNYVQAVRNAPALKHQLETAESNLAKEHEVHRAARDQAREELAAESSTEDSQRSRRLQSFIDLVVQYGIPPTITAYAEKSWNEGKFGEFFAEAYALWRSDPQFLRRNFQPLYLYFENRKYA